MSSIPAPATVAQVGICTALGYSVPAIDAAVRGGITMFSDTPWRGRQGAPLRAAAIDQMPWDMPWVHRMQAMTAASLDNTDWTFVNAANEAAPHVFLAIPSPSLAEPLLDVIKARLPKIPAIAQVFGQGRSAFFFALSAALAALHSGDMSSVLIGAVDSLCTRDILEGLDNRQRLLGSAPRGGIIPGEGAAFILLVSHRAHRSLERFKPQGIVLAAASDVERHHFLQNQPNRAEALTKVFNDLHQHPTLVARRADILHTCETGEPFWAEEFVMAALRCHALMPEPLTRRMAADAFGDLGAAAGAVMLSVGLGAISRKVKPVGPTVLLVAGSSDDGHVGACLARSVDASSAQDVVC